MALLKNILQVIPTIMTSLYLQKMYKSLFSMASHICALMGELTKTESTLKHVICLDQVHISCTQAVPVSLTVHFNTYKHMSASSTASTVVHATGLDTCHVSLLVAYVKVRGTQKDLSYILNNGMPLHRSDTSNILKQCISVLFLDTSLYNTHSLRVGGATEAALQGATDLQVKLMGRWNSLAYLKYIRPTTLCFRFHGNRQ